MAGPPTNDNHIDSVTITNKYKICEGCEKLKPIEVMGKLSNYKKCRICEIEDIRIFGKIVYLNPSYLSRKTL